MSLLEKEGRKECEYTSASELRKRWKALKIKRETATLLHHYLCVGAITLKS